jgi:hypothetical protein
MCLGGVCPVTVSLLVLCEDVRVAFSFEESMSSVEWHVLWNVTTDKRVWVMNMCRMMTSICGE